MAWAGTTERRVDFEVTDAPVLGPMTSVGLGQTVSVDALSPALVTVEAGAGTVAAVTAGCRRTAADG